MARPFKHPKSGIFYFRKKVPSGLRAILGCAEEKISLRTKDPADAKIAHAKILAEVESRWKNLAQGVQSLTHKQIESIAGAIYKELIENHEHEPWSFYDWKPEFYHFH